MHQTSTQREGSTYLFKGKLIGLPFDNEVQKAMFSRSMMFSKCLTPLKRDPLLVTMIVHVLDDLNMIQGQEISSQCISDSIVSSHINTCSFDD